MKKFLHGYWFVSLTILMLVLGLSLLGQGAEVAADFAFAISGVVGLVLSLQWLVAAIREGALGSDVLAAISILATAITGEWIAAAVISLMLASGRALETWAEGRANSQLEALLARAPQQASLVLTDGTTRSVPLSEVALGSRILVRSGEVVPIDGTLVTPGTFDESALTGEPLPVYRGVNEEVASGVLNTAGGVELITTQTSETSTYSALVRLVQQARAASSPTVRIANRWAAWFVPFAVALALGTWLVTGNYAYAVAVIVAATPCPLILAVPVAIIAGMAKAATSGSIIKGGAALEQLARVKVILLDKTGTLTHGGPEVASVAVADGVDKVWLLGLVGSLEQHSPHVVAKALVAHAVLGGAALSPASDVLEDHGNGLSGRVAGHHLRVGQPVGELPAWANLDASLLVAVEVDSKLAGLVGLDDPIREESRQTIADLRSLGVARTILVSGDRHSTVESVAKEVGVDAYFAECKPEHKLEILQTEKAKTGGTVVAVGDGINDAPALAAADVGVAMGARGATAASEAADVVIIEDSIAHLAVAVDIAQGARNRALQASGVGMSLAIAAMLASAFGLLNATAAAISQELIDACAILWALVPAGSQLRRSARKART
jgi:heavy metal translocating P-type ATPase